MGEGYNCTMTIDHDQLFKQLLSTFFVDFLDLFFPEIRALLDSEGLVFLEQEFFTDIPLGEKKLLDMVVKARFCNTPLLPSLVQETFFLVHIENQASEQSRFAERMFLYFIRLFEKHRLPIYPIAVFSYNEPLRPEPSQFQIQFPGRAVLDFQFSVIQLNHLSWRDFLNRPNPVAAALMSKMQIAPEDRPRVKLECLRLLATLQLDPARMHLISGFIDTYLRLNKQEQQHFEEALSTIKAVEREPIMQIVTSWMEQGIEQGLSRGLAQGRQEEARSFVLQLLTRRFGALDEALQQHIQELSVSQLETLGLDLLDFTDLNALHSWLATNRT